MGGKGFKEGDKPNFTGSFYSDTKGMVEKVRHYIQTILKRLSTCLINRIDPADAGSRWMGDRCIKYSI